VQAQRTEYCKITISLPRNLVEYADQEARRVSLSRSEVISRALTQAQKARRNELAARGYAFCSQESEEFAASVASAVSDWWESEDWNDER